MRYISISVCVLITSLTCFSLANDLGPKKQERLLMSDPDAINAQLLTLERKLQEVIAKMSLIEDENSQLKVELVASKKQIEMNTNSIYNQLSYKGGTIYTRWGRKDCPNKNGTQLVYTGIAGGGSHAETGSGTNYLCLPHNPDEKPAQLSIGLELSNYVAHVWGAEYQFSLGKVKVDDDVPCAVCRDTTTETSLMIPAKSSCPSLWKKQYNGLLCANMYGHPAASEYACVDSEAQYFEGKRGSNDGKLFYPAVSVCGSLPCPLYENLKYMTCVVCSK
ncbi:short-chain collagen C4-like [Mytilus trossulus]|uniref:short-chain collagen C4-like n=1 Tax=Mytilus trossulus TaxID=6551 RepID=UPI003007B81B